jgi:hypothetical protein
MFMRKNMEQHYTAVLIRQKKLIFETPKILEAAPQTILLWLCYVAACCT